MNSDSEERKTIKNIFEIYQEKVKQREEDISKLMIKRTEI